MKKFPIFLLFIGSSFASIGAMQQPSEVQTNLPQPQSQLVADYDQLLLKSEGASYLSMLPADVRKLIQIPMHGALFVQAAQKGDAGAVSTLLKAGVPVNLLTDGGKSRIEDVVQNFDTSVIEVLRDHVPMSTKLELRYILNDRAQANLKANEELLGKLTADFFQLFEGSGYSPEEVLDQLKRLQQQG